MDAAPAPDSRSPSGDPTSPPTAARRRTDRATPAQRRAMRAKVVADCPDVPGTYCFLGTTGRIVYVGKSRHLRRRLLSYFRAKGRRDRQARIVRHASDVIWEPAPNEFAALLAELRAIKRHRPTFNLALKTDEWPRAWLALSHGPIAGVRVVRRTDDPRAAHLFGPFRRVAHVRDAARALAEVCGIRDCTVEDGTRAVPGRALWFEADGTGIPPRARLAAERRAPACLRVALGTCDGPCIGGGSRAHYTPGVDLALAFLEGRTDEPVRRAEARMQEAALATAFERAAAWKTRWEALAWLAERIRRFHASMDRLTFRYVVTGDDGVPHAYLVRRGTVRAVLTGDDARDGAPALAEAETRVFRGPDPHGDDVPLHDLDEFYLVASWFRRHPDELAATVRPA